MPSYDLGQVHGSISLDIAQAVAAYAALRRANAATDTALLESLRSLRTVGVGLAGIGAVALAGFGVAVKAAADFQAKMRFFQVVTGSSKKEMKAATAEAFNLAKTSGYTASQIADAFVELGKAGINAQQIVAGVGKGVAQLGAAAQIPMKDSAEIIVNTMKTFQLGAGQAVHIADVLAGTANASTVDIQDLAYSLKYVGGTAASIGVPLEDVANALGQLGNAGVRGSTGGTALRKILLSLSPVSKQARTELEKLGIIQTNGGVSAEKYAKMQDKQKTATDNLRKAQQHLLDIQREQAASAGDRSASSRASDATRAAAAARTQAAAQQRLASAQQHLQEVQQKYASTPLAATASQQASRFAALQSAQDRVAAAQTHLTEVQAKGQAVAARGGQSAASQVRAAIQLRDAQEKVKEAADKARAAGVAVAPGIEKLTNLFFNASGKAKPLSEIFQILQDHMKGMSQEQKVTALNMIFGNRAISSALILTREGTKGFQQFGKAMGETTSADVMRKRLDTLAGSWAKFKGAMSVALIQAGAPAQAPLKILVNLLTDVVKAFTDLPGPVQSVLSGLVLLFGAITGGLGAFILMVSFIGKATRAFREFRMAFAFVKEVQLLQRAFALLNITMLANPVILIVVAVIALAAAMLLLYLKCKPVREFFDTIGRGTVAGFKAVVRFFEGMPAFFGGVWSKIKGFFSAGFSFVKKYWDLLLGILVPPLLAVALWHHFHDQIISAISTIAKDVGRFLAAVPGVIAKGLATAASDVLQFVAVLPNRVLFALGFIIGRSIRWGIDLAKALGSGAKAAYEAVIGFFEKLPGRLEGFAVDMYNREVRGWKNIYNAVAGFARRIFHDVVGFFERLPGSLASFSVQAYHAVINWFKQLAKDAASWAKSAFFGIIHWFQQLPGNALKFFRNMLTNIQNLGSTIITEASNIGSSVYNAISGFVTGLPDMIWNALKAAINKIKDLGGEAFNAMKGWGGSLWKGFKKGLFGSPRTKVEYALEDMTATADKETKKLSRQVRVLNGLATRIPNGQLMGYSTGAHRTNLVPAVAMPAAASAPGKSYDIKVFYPAPEPASQGIERTLNNLEFVGA